MLKKLIKKFVIDHKTTIYTIEHCRRKSNLNEEHGDDGYHRLMGRFVSS